MKEKIIINTEDFRIRILNMLKIYGYYDGILLRDENEKEFVSGNLSIDEIIISKKDFRELKRSVEKLLDYCYENNFDQLIKEVNYFYHDMCKNIRKKYGTLLERL